MDLTDSDDSYVKLISSDGMEFYVERETAINGSITLKAMLEGNFRESEDNVIKFPEIEGMILEKVIKYLHYKRKHSKTTGQIPEFSIEPEIALELLIASNYLQC
mmetsp:Transcript_15166/g.18467  ORF Transcript_15166/g.18467 Transcript_15166/m.18467 type:complete len:104 (+) Transcript_15166:125-436(+)